MAFSKICFLPAKPAWEEELPDLLCAYEQGVRIFLVVENVQQLEFLSRFFAQKICCFSFCITPKSLSAFNLEVRIGSAKDCSSLFPFAAWETSPSAPPAPPPENCSMDSLLYRAFYLVEHKKIPAREICLLAPSAPLRAQMEAQLCSIYRGYFSLTGNAHFLEQSVVHGHIAIFTPEEYALFCCNRLSSRPFSFFEDSSLLFAWISRHAESLLGRYPYLLFRYSLTAPSFIQGLGVFFLSLAAQGYDLYHFAKPQLGDCSDPDLSRFLAQFLVRLAKDLPTFHKETRKIFRRLTPPFIYPEKSAVPRHLLAYCQPGSAADTAAPDFPENPVPLFPVLLHSAEQIPSALGHLATLLSGSIGILVETESHAESLGAALPFPVASQTNHLARTLPALDFAAWLDSLAKHTDEFPALLLSSLLSRFSPRSSSPYYLARWERFSAWLCAKLPCASGPEVLAFLRRAVQDPIGASASFPGETIALGTFSSLFPTHYDWVLLPGFPSTFPSSVLEAHISQDSRHIGYTFSPSRRKQLFSRYYTKQDHLLRHDTWLKKARSCATKGVYFIQISSRTTKRTLPD